MKRLFVRLILVLVILLAGAQFVRPARTNPRTDPAKVITKTIAVPPDVQAIIDRSCRNCHTNDTTWPWYSEVAPMSWSVIEHVNHGREHMNFSDWPSGPEEAADLLDSTCKEVKEGRMPHTQYLLLHSEARLSDADKKKLCDWSNAAAGPRLTSSRPGPWRAPTAASPTSEPRRLLRLPPGARRRASRSRWRSGRAAGPSRRRQGPSG